MQPAILQCFEVGMHMLIPLDVIGLAIGVGIQFLLHKKVKSRAGQWWFAAVNLIGMLVCDIAAQIITGWDLLIPLFLYWLFFTFFLGACICMLVCSVLHKEKK
ncbi:MAG: hypothetical protein IJX64_03445 [Clostridia bacterium]|nr:hypothetical protein [Clostridia bacterium]